MNFSKFTFWDCGVAPSSGQGKNKLRKSQSNHSLVKRLFVKRSADVALVLFTYVSSRIAFFRTQYMLTVTMQQIKLLLKYCLRIHKNVA